MVAGRGIVTHNGIETMIVFDEDKFEIAAKFVHLETLLTYNNGKSCIYRFISREFRIM